MVAKIRPRAILFPTLDYLTPYQQEKKLKELASEVEVYNMYDDIKNVPQIDEIYKMGQASAKKLLETVRSKHKLKDLLEHWGTTQHQLYQKLYPWAKVELRKHNNTMPENIELKEKSITNIDIRTHINIEGIAPGSEIQTKMLELGDILNTNKTYKIVLNIEET